MDPIPTPPSGFGRVVMLIDIVRYAKPNHNTCKNSELGPGTIILIKGKERVADACACAIKRFHGIHSKNIETLKVGPTTEIRWKPGCEPKED